MKVISYLFAAIAQRSLPPSVRKLTLLTFHWKPLITNYIAKTGEKKKVTTFGVVMPLKVP